MNLQAIFPEGVTALTVNGLHQWDYGRTLEIQAGDLPAEVEVHFACPGMTEAEVRVSSVVGGVAKAVIPDKCLEQTAPITAWVYVIDGTAGFTAKTVTLPVIARPKPQPGASVPEEYYDKYTELITEVNAAIAALEGGSVSYATRAGEAEQALYATNAGNAARATYAIYAGPDQTKGTIEERLSAMGFKEGTATLSSSLGGTVATNILKRQGKCVIGAIAYSGGSFAFSSLGYDVAGKSVDIGNLPEGFRPAAAVRLYIRVVHTLTAPFAGGQITDWPCVIKTDGKVQLECDNSMNFATVTGMNINFGFEAA